MLVLIADSGSTKCDWQLLDASGKELLEFHTMGFNPYFHSADKVEEVMNAHADVQSIRGDVTHVFFYGAGSSTKPLCAIIREGLQRIFGNADVTVDHDLVGAAYSTYDGRPGITCIIGTGSNSCQFDGEEVTEEVPPWLTSSEMRPAEVGTEKSCSPPGSTATCPQRSRRISTPPTT